MDDYFRCVEQGRAAIKPLSKILKKKLQSQSVTNPSKAGWEPVNVIAVKTISFLTEFVLSSHKSLQSQCATAIIYDSWENMLVMDEKLFCLSCLT